VRWLTTAAGIAALVVAIVLILIVVGIVLLYVSPEFMILVFRVHSDPGHITP